MQTAVRLFGLTLFCLLLATPVLAGSLPTSVNGAPELAAATCDTTPGNLLTNPSFEASDTGWRFYSNGQATFRVAAGDAADCAQAAEIVIQSPGTNVQLYQSDVALEPNTDYRLTFAAKSSSGRDMSLFLHKDTPRYSSYGLKNWQVDLSSSWQTFEMSFTTSGFSQPVADGRLRFWLAPYDVAGETFWIDDVALVPIDGTPEETPEPPLPTPTVAPPEETPEPPPPTPTVAPPEETPDPPSPTPCDSVTGNSLTNPSFESNTAGWSFYTNGKGAFESINSGAFHCDRAAKVTIQQPGTNVQLNQNGIALDPNSEYRLTFAAKSSSGRDVSLFLHKDTANYSSYGLKNAQANLTTSWQTFEMTFRTEGFSQPVQNARLRFWLAPYDVAGETYWFDHVVLERIGDAPPPPPEETPTPAPTTPPPGGSGDELVIYDWNKPVTTSDRGFPRNQPPQANFDWTTPVNYADGTLYYRAEIKNQPVPQNDMRLQFCFWQTLGNNNFGLENCGRQMNVPGQSGTVVCWSQPVDSMWKLNGRSIDWERPRYRVAVAIKNGAGKPISDYNGWNWNGEKASDWYPLNMRFTVVVVPQGGTFSGWADGC